MPPYTKRMLAQLIVRAWRAAAASPRRASSTSFERRVEAHVQDEAREEATAQRRRSRGDGRVRRHRPAHGVEANGVASGAAQVPVPA